MREGCSAPATYQRVSGVLRKPELLQMFRGIQARFLEFAQAGGGRVAGSGGVRGEGVARKQTSVGGLTGRGARVRVSK